MNDRNIALAATIIVAAELGLGAFVVRSQAKPKPEIAANQTQPPSTTFVPATRGSDEAHRLPSFEATLVYARDRALTSMKESAGAPKGPPSTRLARFASSEAFYRNRHHAGAAVLLDRLRAKGYAAGADSDEDSILFGDDDGRASLVVLAIKADEVGASGSDEEERAAKLVMDAVVPLMPTLVREFGDSEIDRVAFVVGQDVLHPTFEKPVFSIEAVSFIATKEDCRRHHFGEISDREFIEAGKTYVGSDAVGRWVTPKFRSRSLMLKWLPMG